MFVSRSWQVFLETQSLAWETDNDELGAGRRKLLLRFDLLPGCYATVLIKRITAAP